ncbi:MAG: T9SS type A sorting domain-containing protein [Salibacteraceae bacterium]
MKKIYLLALSVVASASSFAQTSLNQNIESKVAIDVPAPIRSSEVSDSRGSATCLDTVDYALYRSLNGSNQFTWANITLEDSASLLKGMGLFFPLNGTQNYTMSGFELQAVGIKADGTPSQLIVSVYVADADSLPMGSPLTTQTISVDTSTSLGFSDGYIAHTFTPLTITSNVVITVEAGSPTDSVKIWTGGVLSGSFDGYPTSLSLGGNWIRPKDAVQLGEVIPRFHPIISYDAINTLASSVAKLSGPNEDVIFTSSYPEIGRSILAFSGLLQDNNTAAIDFGDGESKENIAISETHAYADHLQDYSVTLTDSILLYQSNVGVCVVTETVTIEKAWTVGINDVNNQEIVAYVSNDVIRVENAQGLATLYSITGQVVRKEFLSGSEQTINVSDLQGGIYILSVNDQAVKLKL